MDRCKGKNNEHKPFPVIRGTNKLFLLQLTCNIFLKADGEAFNLLCTVTDTANCFNIGSLRNRRVKSSQKLFSSARAIGRKASYQLRNEPKLLRQRQGRVAQRKARTEPKPLTHTHAQIERLQLISCKVQNVSVCTWGTESSSSVLLARERAHAYLAVAKITYNRNHEQLFLVREAARWRYYKLCI